MQIENDILINPLYLAYNEVLMLGKGMFNHPDRKSELVKLILQDLESLGYDKSAQILEEESMIKLNHTAMKDLKSLLMNGNYGEVFILNMMEIIIRIGELKYNPQVERCALQLLYQQLYVELIVQQRFEEAIQLLQGDLKKHITDQSQFHKLATLVLCQSYAEIQQKMNLKVDIQSYRKELYQTLLHLNQTDRISLDQILELAIQFQIENCPLHFESPNLHISLLEDHRCQQIEPPDQLVQQIKNFDNEVWVVEYSTTMKMIACATKQNSVYIIYLDGLEVTNSKRIKSAHIKDINSLQWNHNDTRLLSAGSDYMINIYCTKLAQVLLKIPMHKSIVFTAVYHPLNGHIYSGGVDAWIGIWTENGQFIDFLETKIVKQILFTSDGKLMVVTYASQLMVNIMDAKQKHPIVATIQETGKVYSSKLSGDDQYLLLNVNLAQPELHLWNMKSYQLIHVFNGFIQAKFQLNCTFIGVKDYFVAVPSEDGNVYLFHKFNPNHKITIHAHDMTVNAIQCKQNFMITASDDHTLKIWGSKSSPQFQPFTLEDSSEELNQDESQQE